MSDALYSARLWPKMAKAKLRPVGMGKVEALPSVPAYLENMATVMLGPVSL